MRNLAFPLLAATACLTDISAAAVLAGFSSFGDDTPTGDITDTTPTEIFAGFTASASQDLSPETLGGSFDTTYGTLALPAAATGNGYARVTSALTFTVTNGTAFSYQLGTLNFDTVSGNTGGANFTVTYVLSGSGSSGNVGTGSGTAPFVSGMGSGSASDYADMDFTFSSVVLAPSQTITISIDPGAGLSQRVDNLLLTGTVIPEPASALLAAFGIIPLLRRRSR